MLNLLSSFIPKDERIVTIEDSAELQLQQPHVVRLETRPPNVEGKGQVNARDLVINSLRMRPERIIVGEVRGPEAMDREPFEDERVRLVGQLGDEREVITTEAVGVVEVPGVVHVGPGEGHVEELLLVGFVLPHGGFDPAESEGLDREFGAVAGVPGLRGGLSGLGRHIVPFLI
jgi:hypothetical protein